jgi:ADP-ribose pyrophosphatase YjhB (NUDIX family)
MEEQMRILYIFGTKVDESCIKRDRASGIVLNDKREIALINSTRYNFHMLPGGGTDLNETLIEALHREIREETGASVEVIHEIGVIVENLDKFKMLQTTYFYLAKTVGEIKEPHLMKDEIESGYQVEWHTIDEAIRIFEEENESEKYIKERELMAVKEAVKYMRENNI